MVEVPIWVLVAMGLAIAVLGLMLWTNLREREFKVKVPDIDSFEEALPSIAGMTRAIVLEGNHAELFYNGDGFFPRLLQGIAEAKETIHYETYVWWKGDICRQVAEAFSARAREGVEVRLMLDAAGSFQMNCLKTSLSRRACPGTKRGWLRGAPSAASNRPRRTSATRAGFAGWTTRGWTSRSARGCWPSTPGCR